MTADIKHRIIRHVKKSECEKMSYHLPMMCYSAILLGLSRSIALRDGGGASFSADFTEIRRNN
jgi:hypothetical protein